jgi:transcriptional regulator with XRE-family HTH domain
MTISKQIGQAIKSKRIAMQLSQKQLSVMAFENDHSNALVSRIENGKHEGMHFSTVYSLLLALNVDILSNLESKNS